MTKEITPKLLKERLDAGEAITLIDVRESWEVARGMLPTAEHILMDDIPDNLHRIPKDRTVVFVCKSGRRSEAVAAWVQAQGWDNVLNLSGGVHRWSLEVDSTFPGRY
jgi:rhodanese-related sulfurtransferase